ncbi:TPA: hypothetical protein NIK08_000701 [Klebsiella variicola subsp. variicola]|uniref:hypothetical protein n=1 Tax=Klebsiella/Raoultella group TaxID=2890311 RepID=UPI000B3F778E|nr:MULTISPECIES: hypothetical protein [Klebsiella]HAT2374376.1 hypothetical protein [Raoultella ornithinolytica]HCF6743433.1 hypothetical protein [Klebsiella variicola subsp. variicola]KAB1784517.1 hypothetical protein FXO02_28075 [Klebsiella pneumoniae]MBD7647021.1 hypothetical protein [Klebsiella pneumoniae]MBV7384343.1 hypothetical protein [Klebsiella pneumoniae]
MNSNLTITRKRLEAIAYGSVRQSQEEGIELARMALTTIDSEMAVPDYFSSLVSAARFRADKAMRRFPQPNYVLNKVAEESGEVIKAVIHYTEGREQWSNVESEIIDNLAMLLRLVTEGDQVIGFTPPDGLQTCIKHVDSDIEPHKRIISIRHKEYVHLDDGQISSHLWLEASPQPADRLTSSLVMWVKRLSLSLRSACPDNKLPKAAMGYLQNNGLISIADCLRGNNEEPPA